MWDFGASYGAKLQGLKYQWTPRREGSPVGQYSRCGYFVHI
jgi:hypothetical protein